MSAPPNAGVPVSTDFDQLLAEWRTDRSVENAADLVASALVLNRAQQAQDAAHFLTADSVDAAPLVREMAQRLLVPRAEQDCTLVAGATGFHADAPMLYADIARAKNRTRTYPHNPIAWMELARCQAVLGQHTAAARAVRVALALAPENRFILRSAARFYVHADDHERALAVLRGARALRADPWLISAELSISMVAGVNPQAYKSAKAIVSADAVGTWHTAELYGAMGTMALHDRGVGKVGKLFARSLRQPTENAIAQAQWAANSNAAISVSEELVKARHSYEALALRARSQGEWTQVIHACFGWSTMEPTSARPLLLGSYCAGVALGDGGTMLQFMERLALNAPNDPLVQNNHAVALAYTGKLSEAHRKLEKLNPKTLNDQLRVIYEATRGLLAYRSGDRDTGVRLYLNAAQLPGAKEDALLASQLMWHLLREEARLQVPGTRELATQLWEKTKLLPLPELRGIRDSVFEVLSQRRLLGTDAVPSELPSTIIAQLPDGTSIRLTK